MSSEVEAAVAKVMLPLVRELKESKAEVVELKFEVKKLSTSLKEKSNLEGEPMVGITEVCNIIGRSFVTVKKRYINRLTAYPVEGCSHFVYRKNQVEALAAELGLKKRKPFARPDKRKTAKAA